MTNLHEQGTVSKRIASLGAFRASNTEVFIDDILEIWVLDIRTLDRECRALHIFRFNGIAHSFGTQHSGAQIAIPAHSESVHALDSRLIQNAGCGAQSAIRAFVGIDLPDRVFGMGTGGKGADGTAGDNQTPCADPVRDKLSPGFFIFGGCHLF